MSTAKKPLKIAQKLIQQIWKLSRAITKKLMSVLLRGLFVFGRRSPRFSRSGFILPTVVMVLLVVALLTTAIVMRSFDRTKNVSNVRINQRVLAATQPAIDRAEAKIEALLADPTLPRSTPTDQALYQAMTGNLPKFTLGDETPLKLVNDFNGGGIDESGTLDENEALKTAWRFPIDTDNNGKFDSYSLYGVYFRNPSLAANRARTPLEARTPPMDNGAANGCAQGANTSASLVGASGWYKTSDGNLKKSFYVFAATVPITNPPDADHETYKGNKGFAALEFQQDQARIPLTNNAVVYDDDLEITPGAGIKLNGRIMTNSNLFIGEADVNAVHFYQVSSTESCFYTAENAKITVGGNVVLGSADPSRPVTVPTVDLFKRDATPDSLTFDSGNSSVSNTAAEASYNSQAYAQRIDQLVQEAQTAGSLPSRVTAVAPNAGPEQTKALQNYFKDRTRRVPFAEVAQGSTVVGTASLGATGDAMRPQDDWMYPTDLSNGAENNSLNLNKTEPPATNPDNLGSDEEELGDRILVGNGLPAEWWKQETGSFVNFYDKEELKVDGSGGGSTQWSDGSGERTRMTQFIPLSDLGDTDRDGFWEKSAAQTPDQPLDGVGGLRVVTGAGIYDPVNSFLPRPKSPITDDPSTTDENESLLDDPITPAVEGFTVVLPDSMPMWDDTNNNGEPDISTSDDRRGDLIMRATAVYHYKYSEYPNSTGSAQKPIACVSSYYNPSTSVTAKNRETLPDGTTTPWDFATNGLSNNGITYAVPSEAETPGASIGTGSSNTDGLFDSPAPVPPTSTSTDLRAKLNYQANLILPNGRFVNEPLRAALKNLDSGTLSLANQSALASAVCALKIISGEIAPDPSVIPHGSIYETAFLDARQVKAIETEAPSTASIITDYNLSLVEHQPLEIRATVLDLEKLRKNPAGGITGTSVVPGDEFLLADSGIIYATRDDALLDLSTPGADMDTRKLNSPVDFRLDPTRRPNGIMLINGSILARKNANNDYKQTEKGLILVSNLPVYVKADAQNGFNLHQNATDGTVLEEFVTGQTLEGYGSNWTDANFYTDRVTPEPLFACRKDQPGLPNCNPGDLWRPATVLADSVTLLSNNFQFGFRDEGDYDLRKNVDNLNNNLRFGGFDQDGVGGINANSTVDETSNGFDVNGDGLATNTAVPETEITGYDLNGDGKIGGFTINEDDVGFDLNGGDSDNNATDDDDPDVRESEITLTAARRLNGFFDNNYLTSSNWFDSTTGYPKDFDTTATGSQGSSYVNNFVTPIQRRVQDFPEYVMEICRKPLVEQCGPNEWVVNVAGNQMKASQIPLGGATPVTDLLGTASPSPTPGAGTTARLPLRPIDQHYPRRVAFLRNPADNTLVLDSNNVAIPLGISGTGNVEAYNYDDSSVKNPPVPATPPSDYWALWFKTTSNSADPTDPGGSEYGNASGQNRPLFYTKPLAVISPTVGTTQQPLLVPILQLHTPTANATDGAGSETQGGRSETWMQKPAATTTFNLIIASGDTPTRNADATAGTVAEFNGGMPNFPGFLEDWGNSSIFARISGSFIQFKRSAYATAPYLHLLDISGPEGVFGYAKNAKLSESTNGKSPYYVAPNRQWGFDVGLLSQLPDLFSQRITTPSAGEPNRFYRELSRNDDWVTTLLCSGVQTAGETTPTTADDIYANPAVEETERPNNCQSIGASF